jgi:hypothetical protein
VSNAETLVKQLIEARDKAIQNSKAWGAEAKRIDGQLAEVINPEDLVKQAGKDQTGGATTVELYGAKFTVEAEKKVKWDSTKLQKVASRLTWPVVLAIFKIKFEIAEAKHKDLTVNAGAGMFDPEILKAINDARTVEIGEAKIKSAELVNQ